jgi:streptomycin 6-kinase
MSWPDQLVADQALGLRLWNGQGTVQLVDADPAAGALLLKRLDGLYTLAGLPLPQAVPLIGTVLRRLAIPAPNGYQTTGNVAAELHESLRHRWEATGRPLAPQVLDTALGLAEDLSPTSPTVMVDRDLHYEQVLSGQREHWLVIDPQVLVGDIEHQCGQLLWTRLDEMVGRRSSTIYVQL